MSDLGELVCIGLGLELFDEICFGVDILMPSSYWSSLTRPTSQRINRQLPRPNKRTSEQAMKLDRNKLKSRGRISK